MTRVERFLNDTKCQPYYFSVNSLSSLSISFLYPRDYYILPLILKKEEKHFLKISSNHYCFNSIYSLLFCFMFIIYGKYEQLFLGHESFKCLILVTLHGSREVRCSRFLCNRFLCTLVLTLFVVTQHFMTITGCTSASGTFPCTTLI